MKTIIMLPIEPLDSRYSKQWLKWFEQVIRPSDFDLRIVDPEPLTKTIQNGAFLDVCGTNYYKACQLQVACMMIHHGHVKEGDIFFLHDAWFPGVEMLAYMRDGLGLNFKITGCLHAGTYDPTDFISRKGMGVWGENLENSWFKIYDKVFVATFYHQQLIRSNRNIDRNKIAITGFPLYPNYSPMIPKKNIVVFPHRLTEDKRPDLFDTLRAVLAPKYLHWEFVKTQEIKRTKTEYYQLLSQCKIAVSFAEHENWGIGMQEAVIAGCLPVVPNRLSYKEMYPQIFKYDSFTKAVEMVESMMNYYDGVVDNEYYAMAHDEVRDTTIECGEQAIGNILEELRAI